MYKKSVTQQYNQTQFNTIDRGRLLMMMFDGALNFLRHSRDGIAKNDKGQFARFLSKAHAVISELNNTLDFEKGGAIARELERLYDFMLFHLTSANLTKDGKKIDDVIRVLQPIADAYREILTHGDINYDELEAQVASAKKEAQATALPVREEVKAKAPDSEAKPAVPNSQPGSRIRISF